jgi:hypothetical protein
VADRDWPPPTQRKVLEALSLATREKEQIDQALAEERRRIEEAVALLHQSDERDPPAVRSWEKSERAAALEEARRKAKQKMTACVEYLCLGRIYSEGAILETLASDDRGACRGGQRAAISRADVFAALSSIDNRWAHRSFVLRHKFGLTDAAIAEEIGTAPDAINRLCRIALGHIHKVLNAPVVAQVRSEFYNFLLQHNLEFPDYQDIRGR